MALTSEYVFDIGAFTGVYSMTAALANGEAHIFAFEPIKRVFGRMTINLVANRLGGRVKAFDVALSDSDGHMSMNLFQGYFTLSTGSSLLEKDKEVISKEYVQTMRFDTFAKENGIPRMDLAKIDVEQAEKLVIEGMMETLDEHHPNLLIEVVSEENLRELNDTLSPLGYNFAVIDDRKQKIRINQLEDYEKVDNVLFSVMSPEELRAFCDAVEPLSTVYEGRHERQTVTEHRSWLRRLREKDEGLREKSEQLQSTRERLRKESEQLRACRQEIRRLQSTRGWRIARGIDAAVSRTRDILRRGT